MISKKTHSSLVSQAAHRRRLRKMLKQMLEGGMAPSFAKNLTRLPAGHRKIVAFPVPE